MNQPWVYIMEFYVAMIQDKIKRSLPASNNMLLPPSCSSRVWHWTTYRLQPVGLPRAWHSLGKSTRVGGYVLFQGIFPTQGSNPGLLHGWQILYHWATKEALNNRERKKIMSNSDNKLINYKWYIFPSNFYMLFSNFSVLQPGLVKEYWIRNWGSRFKY